MNIVQVSATFPPYMGGTGNVCYHNSVGLAELGHDVTVYTSKTGDYHSDCDSSYEQRIHVMRFDPLFRVGNAPFLPRLVRIEKCDVIHIHLPFFFGDFLIYIASLIGKLPYVVTYHNDVIFHGQRDRFVRLYYETALKLTINRALRVCVTSKDYFAHSMIRNFLHGRENDIAEIPNGVDLDRFGSRIDCRSVFDRYKHLRGKKVALFVGALDSAHYFKGVEVLLKSFSSISNPDYALIVVGDGNLRNYYVKLSYELGVNEKCIFPGRVSDVDLPSYYSVADVVVLPSLTMGEAFGMVLIEAMACGKAVIATDLPGVRTVVDHEKNGFLVRPGDVSDLASKLDRLFQSDGIRQTFGDNGRAKAIDKYSWKSINRTLELIYKKVIA